MSAAGRAGRVILVGAGPGDPDLITLKGAAALRRADAVVYDALAPSELLDLAPPGAQRINVGKRGHEAPTRSQEETVELLLELARQGKTVVRLKGGDPFVFGRGAEEASACSDAGIPFEVVPGVSAAIGALACAGIPVTDRRYAASFAVVTGHRDPTRVTEKIRWRGLAESADTLVVLMGVSHLDEITRSLIEAGRDPSTPAAVVEWGSTPRQRVVEAPLAELVDRVREADLRAPAAVVVGDVVRLRSAIHWCDPRPLAGKRVVVTRSVEQAGELSAALRAAGAEPVVVPMIRLVPVEDPSEVERAIAQLDDYDALLFTSANAVRFFAEHAAAGARSLCEPRAQVVCVGPATAQAAARAGLRVDIVPPERYDAEGMLAEILHALPVRGARFLLPRAASAREVLPDGLREAGAYVDAVPVYRNVRPEVDAAAVRKALVRAEFFALTFTSPSAVRRFVELLDDESRAAAARCATAAIGPVTAEAMRSAGLEPWAVAAGPSAAELVAALAETVGGSR
ncbi:MAG: uroporphyrinogen-III C-methyltransferase [Deltaproteobacteria bacterium]|nr:MAG: uroporphyrinogen-III C-methyltransferase [Deltaproteobacteria bacterium]